MNIPPITLPTGRKIASGHPAYIIAEIGSNHDADLDRAKMLIHQAKGAGADAVKFQSFQAENLLNPLWKKNGVWEKDPVFAALQKLSLPKKWHYTLANEAKTVGIDFLSTPFDCEMVELLLELDVPALKIASGDLTYHELIATCGKAQKPIFLSTGHSMLGEVEAALKVLWEAGCKDIVLLHCASIYPAADEDANIAAMVSMQTGFQVQVGYSDHTPGFVVPLGAIAKGASVLEKHFTDDKSRKGPDHPFALEPMEFAEMVKHVRNLEAALKGGMKTFRPKEKEERVMARRAIYAKTSIPKGNPIKRGNVHIVRHAYREGVPADLWKNIEGKIARQDIKENMLITWDMV